LQEGIVVVHTVGMVVLGLLRGEMEVLEALVVVVLALLLVRIGLFHPLVLRI
jgi:hypothetical protein